MHVPTSTHGYIHYSCFSPILALNRPLPWPAWSQLPLLCLVSPHLYTSCSLALLVLWAQFVLHPALQNLVFSNKAYSTITTICSPVCSCAVSTCFLVILHLTIRMMTTTVHTNISSTSVDGIIVLRMIMVDTDDNGGGGHW